ncbi:MAG: chromosomal replication initiator protein DnaA [Candidatus Pacebacteria bacterium]|nr:chromosomal replication initiator protein DnaA [Candidatus Paceibacterota bacterium]
MTYNLNELWGQALSLIEKNISKANFNTWFKNTHIIKESEGEIIIGVPNEFVRDWLLNKYNKLILKSIIEFAEEIRSVQFEISKGIVQTNTVSDGTTGRQEFPKTELPLKDLYINRDDNLNPKYTFESFIVGDFNELAYAASQAIVSNPGGAYNPLFVYGDTGLGKTHLLQATGNMLKSRYSDCKVFYTTLEKFAMDYVSSVQNNKPNLFKEKYRKYDALIIDDIQFITGKDKTQEELFHLFNELYEHNKQIIFSSDKHPNFISGLEERLKSRFAAGMIVNINNPEYESRVAIIKEKLADSLFVMNDQMIGSIAETVEGNIRELEGALNIIVCQTQLKKRELTIPEVKNLIKNSTKPKKNVSIKEIVLGVSNFYNVDEASIYEKTRRKEVVKARQVVMYILREDFNISFPLIGQKLGGKDHTTVIHSCLKVKNELKKNTTLIQEIDQVRLLFK